MPRNCRIAVPLARTRRFLPTLALAVLAAAASAGCNFVENALGMKERYLLEARDVLALPGQSVLLRAKLKSGTFLREQENKTLRVFLNGQPYATTATNDEGVAEVLFHPPGVGDYRFTIQASRKELATEKPVEASLLVACRDPSAPMAVIDLDWTVVAGSFEQVLQGDPPAMAGAADVLRQLAGGHTIVYLTHRPSIFGPKTKDWLSRHDMPAGAVILAPMKEFVKGSEEFKTCQLRMMRAKFPRMDIGIGDRNSDARAYLDNGMRPIVILHASKRDKPADLRKLADSLGELPDTVQVAFSWQEIGNILFRGASQTGSEAQKRLRDMAENR